MFETIYVTLSELLADCPEATVGLLVHRYTVMPENRVVYVIDDMSLGYSPKEEREHPGLQSLPRRKVEGLA